MTTITLWLLITVGSTHSQALVIERFETSEDCEAVRTQLLLPVGFIGTPTLSKCIKAKVVK